MGGRMAARIARFRRLALSASLLLGGTAWAYTPADALSAAPASERTLRQVAAVAAAEDDEAADAAGTSATLRARPGLRYGADLEDPATLGADLDLDLTLSWRYDRARLLGDRADARDARARLRHWQRSDVRDALRLLGTTLRAEVALGRARLDLARARRAGPDAPEARRAEALEASRQHALRSLRERAEALGLRGEARLAPFAFRLPAPPDAPPEQARLALALEAARAEQAGAATFEVLRDVSLDATFESKRDRFQLSASLSLDRGRPAASLEGEVGAQQDDQWSLGLSADIRLDGRVAAARADAAERVRRAEAALEGAASGYPRRVAEARRAVADARLTLDAELFAWRRDVAAAPGAALSPRACRSRLARENAVYGAWLDLVSATYDYLEVVDGAWAGGAPDAAAAPAEAPRPGGRAAGTAGGRSVPLAAGWPVRPSACAAAGP